METVGTRTNNVYFVALVVNVHRYKTIVSAYDFHACKRGLKLNLRANALRSVIDAEEWKPYEPSKSHDPDLKRERGRRGESARGS